MLKAYTELHELGYAHSVEVYIDDELAGGLYGVSLGKMFYGESMFSKKSNTSKIALVALALQLKEWGFRIIDTQVETEHLNSLGATLISRNIFENEVTELTQQSFKPQKWVLDDNWQNFIPLHLMQKP
jgi:leucyl/phenylalanyl-tRNA--protein transferase